MDGGIKMVELTGDQAVNITPIQNLLLNMSSGLLPKDLDKKEIKLLEKEFGKNWFYELGYDDSYYKPVIK